MRTNRFLPVCSIRHHDKRISHSRILLLDQLFPSMTAIANALSAMIPSKQPCEETLAPSSNLGVSGVRNINLQRYHPPWHLHPAPPSPPPSPGPRGWVYVWASRTSPPASFRTFCPIFAVSFPKTWSQPHRAYRHAAVLVTYLRSLISCAAAACESPVKPTVERPTGPRTRTRCCCRHGKTRRQSYGMSPLKRPRPCRRIAGLDTRR